MNLQKILIKHQKWFNSESDGVRANLIGANLIWANLIGANLRGANLIGANLIGANLCEANLRGADLRGANLHVANLIGANLIGANLIGANLCEANLCEANLRGADLSGANLCGANLRGADLRGADLINTCLDPNNKPNADVIGYRKTGKYIIGWRTQQSTHCGNTEYKTGETYIAPIFSTAYTECHPGLYLWPSKEAAQKWSDESNNSGIVKVKSLAADVHRAGDKWRTKKFTVIG